MKSQWIKQRRKELGITQEELATRLQILGLGYTSGAISHWENGRYPPPIDDPVFVKAIATVLKMSVNAVLSASGYEITTRYSDDALRAAEIVEQLPNDKRGLAIGILEQILKEA